MDLNQLSERYARRVEVIKRLQFILSEDPGFATEIQAVLADAAPRSNAAPAHQPASDKTYAEKIIDLFKRNSNIWMSVSDIRERADLPRSGIANVIYKSHSEMFEQKPHPTHKKMKLWRLKPKSSQSEAA